MHRFLGKHQEQSTRHAESVDQVARFKRVPPGHDDEIELQPQGGG
jgi:hypothetical protein